MSFAKRLKSNKTPGKDVSSTSMERTVLKFFTASIAAIALTACTDVRYAMTPEVMHNAKTGHVVECKGSGAIYASSGLIGAQAEKDGCVEKYQSLGYQVVTSESEMESRRKWR